MVFRIYLEKAVVLGKITIAKKSDFGTVLPLPFGVPDPKNNMAIIKDFFRVQNPKKVIYYTKGKNSPEQIDRFCLVNNYKLARPIYNFSKRTSKNEFLWSKRLRVSDWGMIESLKWC